MTGEGSVGQAVEKTGGIDKKWIATGSETCD